MTDNLAGVTTTDHIQHPINMGSTPIVTDTVTVAGSANHADFTVLGLNATGEYEPADGATVKARTVLVHGVDAAAAPLDGVVYRTGELNSQLLVTADGVDLADLKEQLADNGIYIK